MKENILGSKNPVKLAALENVIQMFPFLGNPKIITYEAVSAVNAQPLTLYETMTGARNRAVDSYNTVRDEKNVLAYGIESGLMDIPMGHCTKADICVCVIFDGNNFYTGFSQPFLLPRNVEVMVVNNGMDLNGAFHKLQLTDNPKIGHAEGMVSILSKGKVTRQSYTEQAILGALIQLEQPGLYIPVTCF